MPTTTPATRPQSQPAKRSKAKAQKTTRPRRKVQEASDSLASKRNGAAVAADGKPEIKHGGYRACSHDRAPPSTLRP